MPQHAENPFIDVALAQAKLDPAKDPAKVFAALRKGSADTAPTAQAATNITPQASLSQLTGGFDVTRIPLPRLKQMMRDPMIAFGLFFIRAQILRARWSIESSNPQIAAFVDNALREIWAPFVSTYLMKLGFGYQAMVKRFELAQMLDWTYFDGNSEKPVWSEGAVQPLIWKPFVPLPHEAVDPLWTSNGEFDGIHYKPVSSAAGSQAKEQDFNVLHCSPPDELVLTTNRGYVPIGELDQDTDKLVVWDKKQKRFCRTKGFAFELGSRKYKGDLLTIAAGDGAARVTPNHKFTVRWLPEAHNKYSVYLMKKGDWWRMGITRVAREGSKSSGLGIRLSAEGGEAAWVLGTFDSKNEALYHEKLWSNQYGIPDMIFQSTATEGSAIGDHCLTTTQIEQIWEQLDSASGALGLLEDLKLDPAYPFLKKSATMEPRGTRGWTCHAVNMIDGLMEIPVDTETERAEWATIRISRESYDGDVFSIEVPPHHHYVSNGVVTQNSLWVTNEKESVMGSLWGYPRIGYAYRFWWSFWFNWGLADRHFEKDADPPAIVYYPANKPPLIDSTGQEVSRRDMALNIGERARSNSTIALPGDPVIGEDGSTKNMREWEIDFAKGGGNFDVFEKRFDQLQVMLLRSIFVPEEAFQAKGGSAGYNSTSQLQEAFVASQIVLMQEIDFDLNRYVIPQLVMANFQKEWEAGVKVRKVTKGFDSNDVDLAKLIIQGIANKDASSLPLDVEALLDAVGLPRLSPEKIAEQKAQQDQQAKQATPPEQPAQPGVAGVNKQGLYYAPRDEINLAQHEADARFMAELVSVGALADPIVLSDAQRLRSVWRQALNYELAVATNLLQDYGNNLDLDETFFERLYRRISNRAHDTAAHSRRALAGIMRRASTREMERAGLRDFSWDPSYSDAASRYLKDRSEMMVQDITNTTREQIRTYLADLVDRKVEPSNMPALLRSHFSMFSEWRSDLIVRTEVANAYNMAVLLAAKDAGIKQVQAIDAQLGPDRSDPECIDRNGRIFTIDEAFAEQLKEHPNGTLEWRILHKPVRVKRAKTPKNAPNALANFGEDEVEVTLSDALTDRQVNTYLRSVVDRMNEAAHEEIAAVA